MGLPYIIEGGLHRDARGVVKFVNDFDMSLVKRFYTITNSKDECIRGWIMHKHETKWFFPIRGETVISIEADSEERQHMTYVLDAAGLDVLCVPPGNWFCIKQDGMSEVQVFSSCYAGEFENDDFRREV